jgi:hypothetical protein
MTIRAGIICDHYVSMRPLTVGAAKDYNSVVESLKGNYEKIYVSRIECGRLNVLNPRKAKVRVDFRNAWADTVPSLSQYVVDGQSTPLWDSVNTGIDTLMWDGGFNDTYILMTITDGGENSSDIDIGTLKRRIEQLQATDRWTFVFRVPLGYRGQLLNLGIPAGNIIEWEQTEVALAASTAHTVSAMRSYVSDVSKGVTSSRSFYDTSALEDIRPADLRAELTDITDKVRVESVWSEDEGTQIRDFCMKSFGEFEIGRAYYQLDKTEKVQPSKKLIIKHKKKGKYYSGDVRSTLSLPSYGEIKLKPADHPDYEVYVQSTSVNRKMTKKTKVVYI